MPQSSQKSSDLITDEYRILHKVAQAVQSPVGLKAMLREAMLAVTDFQDLKVENKAGIFLVDEEKKVLRLFHTVGKFSSEFLERERKVPFGDCLCGRVAVSGELLMSESCFTDARHERTFSDMTAHGHYIVPLKADAKLIGVMFLYTNTHPVWYQHSQEVLLSIGGLIANAIQKKQVDAALEEYSSRLESLVERRTAELTSANRKLAGEVEGHKNTQEELRRLAHQIQGIREEEKGRIAREVHDELGQSMTALKMDLSNLEKKLPAENPDLLKQARSMENLLDAAIKSVQRIAMELRPPILDAFGLCEAIVWQAGEYEKRFGLKFDLNCLEEHAELEGNLKTALFRIFQEAVTNVVRHAEASAMAVEMKINDGTLQMEICDNGKGIQDAQVRDSFSLGLIGIRERVRPFKGEVRFLGTPGKGTRVVVRIPIQKT